MYGLFIDKSATDSKSLLEYLSNWKQKNSLQTQEYQITGVDDITTILKKNGSKFNTVIAIGDADIFDALVGESRLLDSNIAFAYVPTTKNTLSRRLGIRDYKDGFETVAQRKIVELTALSINQQYFLFDYTLQAELNKSKEPIKTIIKIDKSLEIKMGTYKIVIHNRNQEIAPHNSALLIEAFNKKIKSDRSNNILKIPGLGGDTGSNKDSLQLRLPAQSFTLESSQSMYNLNQKALKNPIRVGLHKKNVRIIVKRGQEIQAIMSTGLIS